MTGMQQNRTTPSKIVSDTQLLEIRSELKNQGESLVQCHGCFDIVHPGHIRHLQFAASQGDRLIVSITADAFVNKGPGRPMFTHQLRAENLAALEFVDWVYIHHAPTAVDLLEMTKPDIYIKGAEYAQANDPRFIDEREIVENNNGRVVFSSGDVVFSSTSIVESIQKSSRPDPDMSALTLLLQKHDLSTSNLHRLLKNAAGSKVLVVGETILDTYTHCRWPEIADEHPILSLRPYQSQQYDGGAAVVAKHLSELGACPVLCTPVPTDFDAQPFIDRMNACGVEVIPIEVDGQMPEKKRYLVGRDKVMKLDCTMQMELTDRQQSMVMSKIETQSSDLDAAILVDFGLGFFDRGLSTQVAQTLRDRVQFMAGDVSGVRSCLESIAGADVLCPSESELRRTMNDQDSPVEEVASRLIVRANAQAVVVTRGSNGLVVITRQGQVWSLPALSYDPIDVLGCGDALLASMTMGMLGGAGVVESAYIGSLAASVAGSMIGNEPVGFAQVMSRSQALGAQLACCASPIELKMASNAAERAII